MNRSPLLALGALAILAAATGCSGSGDDPFGPEPDFAGIEQKVARPTGTFAVGRESSLFGEYAARRAGSNELDVSGTRTSAPSGSSTGGVKSQALDLLGAGMGSASQVACSDLQYGRSVGTCACPGGGDFAYDFAGAQRSGRGGPIDATLKIRFNACATSAGAVDGREFVKIRSSSGLGAKDLFLILSLDVTLTSQASRHHLAADMVYSDGAAWLAVQVDDGYVVVSAQTDGEGKNGTFTVRDRNTTWTCSVSGGKGTCTSSAGETRTVR
jgi:hypothetical protein